MNARHDNADGPEDIDAAFAEIVAGLESEAPMSRWPDEAANPPREHENTGTAAREAADTGREDAGPRDWSAPEDAEDEGHYEPPEPPPLPRPRLATIGGVVVLAVGVLLLVVPGLAGLGSTAALPAGLTLISAGIAWLLFRMRQGPHDADDDGAQL